MDQEENRNKSQRRKERSGRNGADEGGVVQAPRGGRRLRSETTTTGICPAISGATQCSPCFECSRLDSYVSIKTSSQLTARDQREPLANDGGWSVGAFLSKIDDYGPVHGMAPRPFWEAPRVATIIFGCGLTRGFYSPTFIALSTLAKSPWLFQNCSVPV